MLDFTTLTASIATIMGLVVNFKGERRALSDDEYQEFLTWLIENNHEDIKCLLEQNTKTSISIKALLKQKTDDLLNRFDVVDTMLAHLLSRFDEFSDLVDVIKPNAKLSDQAFSILEQMENAQCSFVIKMRFLGGEIVLLGDDVQINPNELRFLDDDLLALVNFGFLIPSKNKQGQDVYTITRQASEYIANVKKNLDS